jgi:curved DNA-binding protein CbpA
MTVNTAYKILRLAHNAGPRDLVLAYRSLVKRYHPDYNANREAWSNEKMTQLNLAYETVRGFMAARSEAKAEERGAQTGSAGAGASGGTSERGRAEPSAGRGPGPRGWETGATFEDREAGRDAAFGARTYSDRARARQLSPQFARLFDKPWQLVVDGVYVYYQYGLENVHMRSQGVHRFRYRQALKNLKDGIAALEPLEEDTVTEVDATRLSAAWGFSRAFLQNMLIEKYYIPTRVRSEKKAYDHYRNGSRHLDHAIKRRFCRELSEPRDFNAAVGTFEVIQYEFISVIAEHTESTWVPESMIKMHLLDRFNAVVKAELSA